MPLIENHPHLCLSGPPGGHIGQGMARAMPVAKRSTGRLSGDSS